SAVHGGVSPGAPRPEPSAMDAPLDAPLLLSGALGGPFVVYVLTPMRNALTLGSQDSRSVAAGLYRKVFRGGWASGWKGGGAPAVMACPQFLAVGPAFHVMHQRARELSGSGASSGHRVLPALAASCGAGLFETALTYAAQSRNAQIAYNNLGRVCELLLDRPDAEEDAASSEPGLQALGAGLRRNGRPQHGQRVEHPKPVAVASGAAARFGISELQREGQLLRLPGVPFRVYHIRAGEPGLQCSRLSSYLRPPPEKSPAERLALARHFLNRQYFVPLQPDRMGYTAEVERYSWNISRVVARDFCLRSSYAISLLMLFMSIERTLCAVLRPYELKRVCEKSRGLDAQPVEMCLARH
ncbi:unnamed protein product, partial [Prorocentrum cordatum]